MSAGLTIPTPPRVEGTAPNPVYATMLHKAIPHLWDGVSEFAPDGHAGRKTWTKFICLVAVDFAPDRGTQYLFEDDIQRRLEAAAEQRGFRGICNCDAWASTFNSCREVPDPAVQAMRRAWMLQLIEEFGGVPADVVTQEGDL